MEQESKLSEKGSVKRGYEYASVISLVCYIAMFVAAISCLKDLNLQFSKSLWNWILKIPEWVVVLLGGICWTAIFIGLSDYYKKTFKFKSKLFVITAIIEVIVSIVAIILTDDADDVIFILSLLLVVTSFIIMLVIGIQLLQKNIGQKVATAFIVYAIVNIILLIFSLSEIEPSLWIIIEFIIEIFALYLINRDFSKMAKEEDLIETRNKIFKNE